MTISYATSFELMQRMGLEEDDTREGALIMLVEQASRWIEQQTGHRFYQTAETRYYNALDRSLASAAWSLDTLEKPWGSPQRIEIDDVGAVTQVATDEDGDGVYERLWAAPGDYWLGPRNAPVNGKPYKYLNRNAASGRYLFPLWEESIQITGTFGYSATTPSPIHELCLIVAETMAQTLGNPAMSGVLTYKLADELTITMGGTRLSEPGQEILNYYRGERPI